MAHVDWNIRGPQISTCNCAWGCPCQFNGLPTHGDCRAAVAMQIEKGHFGSVYRRSRGAEDHLQLRHAQSSQRLLKCSGARGAMLPQNARGPAASAWMETYFLAC